MIKYMAKGKNNILFSSLIFLFFSLNAFFTVLSTLNDEATFLLNIADTGAVIIKIFFLIIGLFWISYSIKEYTLNDLFVFIILSLFFIIYQLLLGNYINYIFLIFILF